MRSKLFISLSFIIPLILISGCINEKTKIDDPEVNERTTTDHSDLGEGYLVETESENVFSYTLDPDECLISMTCQLVWEDEDPVDRPIRYQNEGDQFTVTITNGDNISIIDTRINAPGYTGTIICRYQGDGMDWETISRPMTFYVEIYLVNAGDQYHYLKKDEATKVEDIGNEYSWTIEYTIMV